MMDELITNCIIEPESTNHRTIGNAIELNVDLDCYSKLIFCMNHPVDNTIITHRNNNTTAITHQQKCKGNNTTEV